jgi:hypothetical protein
MWSRIGRLRRNNFPKLTGGGHTFGGGAGPGLMAVLAGRLLCDTYLSGEALLRGISTGTHQPGCQLDMSQLCAACNRPGGCHWIHTRLPLLDAAVTPCSCLSSNCCPLAVTRNAPLQRGTQAIERERATGCCSWTGGFCGSDGGSPAVVVWRWHGREVLLCCCCLWLAVVMCSSRAGQGSGLHAENPQPVTAGTDTD